MAKKQPGAADPAAFGRIPREWSWFASGPLRGCCLLRERGRALAWDASNVVTLLDLQGVPMHAFACPQPIVAVAAADTGTAIVVLGQSGRLWWLDQDLEPVFLRDRPGVPVGLALDAHGRYAALAWDKGLTQVVGADNREYAAIETRQPLKRLLWTTADGYLFGAADNGVAGLWDCRGREYWSEGLWVGVGGTAASGDGEALFLACPQQGILRFNIDGKREGCYRLDGLPTLVASDFAGRRLVASTSDKKLFVLTYQGVVEAQRTVPDEVVGLQCDALGRFALWATRAGELRLAALDDLASAPAALHTASAAGLAELPDWEAPAAASLDEARTALLEAIPGAGLAAVLTSSKKLRIFDGEGDVRHETEPLVGIGRTLHPGPGWLLASSDSSLLAYDPAANRSWTAVETVYDTSHAEPLATPGEVLHVSSCEFVSRLRLDQPGEAWKFRAEEKIDAFAAQPDGHFAMTSEDRKARFFSPAGKRLGAYKANPPEPLLLAALDGGGWATIGRDSRTLRGHEPDGKLLWAAPLPWPPWGLKALGPGMVAVGDHGESMLVDASGFVLAENREPRPGSRYAFDEAGAAVRLHLVENALVAADFAGKVRWRHAAEKPIAAFATDGRGVWAILGKTLCWFPFGA